VFGFGFKITLSLRGVENDIFKARGPRHTTPIRRAIDKSFLSGFRCVKTIGAALALASAVTAIVSIQRERG
jgi:hypothetical protein